MRRFFIFLTVFVILCTTCLTGFCVNYPNDFAGIIENYGYDTPACGYYIFGNTQYGDALVLIPAQYKDYIGLTEYSEPYNISSSTIRGVLFVGSTTTKRDYYMNGFDYIEYYYRTLNGITQYRPINFYEIYDTNIEFNDAVENEYLNSSVYWSKYEKAVIISLVTIIFLLFLGWFLLHRR